MKAALAIAVDDRPRDAAFFVESALHDLQCADVDLNRYDANRAARIADAVALARRNPGVYVHEVGSDAADLAERAAVFDIAMRLKSSEAYVKSVLFVARDAMSHLPALWSHARDGFVSMYLVERTVGALLKVRAPARATREEHDAEREATRLIDEATSDWAFTCSPSTFLRRLRTLVERLAPESPEVEHARARRDRRMTVQHEDNGMSWLSIYLPTIEALAIKRRATSTAKHLQKDPREIRTPDQLRADLCSAWLRGVGTDRAVETKIFVTIPFQLLEGGGGIADLPLPQAEIVGHGPIDSLTAKQLFLETSVFRRVIVDPINSVVLDMDRRSRRATQTQRDWLILQHGTCARDGCDRLALDADIDHETPWVQGGKTNVNELRPLCPRDHVNRHRTRAIYRSRPDRSVQVITPTGFHSSAPSPVKDVLAPF
ncbi:hypothetical protein DC31_12845 [Microbacterium sp. CH12i]|uniref:HNH endonuclease signature motif containing protein n=1 Tax=Microbacterium sp. CH12i TaxID=1479651 RepID=UPI000460AD32|nr:HNH endonuclease signature motif containing protein [Microbacterium sp. CH12i]KDA06182.1 hypothetical protein DC31_12845 [Microbacterium sp. CH12i]